MTEVRVALVGVMNFVIAVMQCFAYAQPAQSPETITVLQIGDEKASVTLDLYLAFSCGHCAEFMRNILGEIEGDEIKNNKVRLNIKFGMYTMLDPLLAYIFSCVPEKLKAIKDFMTHQDEYMKFNGDYLDLKETKKAIEEFCKKYKVTMSHDFEITDQKIIYGSSLKPYEDALIKHSTEIINPKDKMLHFPSIYYKGKHISPPPQDLSEWKDLIEKKIGEKENKHEAIIKSKL